MIRVAFDSALSLLPVAFMDRREFPNPRSETRRIVFERGYVPRRDLPARRREHHSQPRRVLCASPLSASFLVDDDRS